MEELKNKTEEMNLSNEKPFTNIFDDPTRGETFKNFFEGELGGEPFANIFDDNYKEENPDQKGSQKPFWGFRAPSMNTAYIGLSTHKLQHVTTKFGSNTERFLSTLDLQSSTLKFKSSHDILEYLKSHPDYQRLPPSIINAIIGAIIAGLLITGGIVLTIVTAGSASPVAALVWGAGIKGMSTSIEGFISGKFSWDEYFKSIGISSALTIITFGAGFLTGFGVAGLKLIWTGLTKTALKVIAAVGGALVVGGTKVSAYILITKLEGGKIELLHIIIEALDGLYSGAQSALAGAEARLVSSTDKISIDDSMEAGIKSGSKQILKAGEKAVIVFESALPVIEEMITFEGWSKQNEITEQSSPNFEMEPASIQEYIDLNSEVLQKAMDVSSYDLNLAKQGDKFALQLLDSKLAEMLSSKPQGITPLSEDSFKHVYKVTSLSGTESFVQVDLLNEKKDSNKKCKFRASIIKESDFVPFV